jgi:hypothetical protein
VAKLTQFDDVNRLIGEMMSGLSIRHDLGSELDDVGRLIGDKPISRGDADVSLYDFMQDGMGVLLDASTERKAPRLVAASTQRIRCLAVDTGPSLLIRPDACIAWAGEVNSTDGLEEALHAGRRRNSPLSREHRRPRARRDRPKRAQEIIAFVLPRSASACSAELDSAKM